MMAADCSRQVLEKTFEDYKMLKTTSVWSCHVFRLMLTEGRFTSLQDEE